MRKRLGSLIVSLGLAVACPEGPRAEIEGIQLKVDGLSCPFCALGLDKGLKQRAGLEGIQIHMKQGTTEARLPHGKGLDVGKVRRAVQEAGFTLRELKLTVIGTVSRKNGHFTVESRGDKTRFLLFDAEHRDTGPESTPSQPLQQQLQRVEQTGKLVRVSGLVHEHVGLPPALLVETVEELVE